MKAVGNILAFLFGAITALSAVGVAFIDQSKSMYLVSGVFLTLTILALFFISVGFLLIIGMNYGRV